MRDGALRRLVALAATITIVAPALAVAEPALGPIVNVSPAFPAGPYSTFAVAAGNPSAVAVGTPGGTIAWSTDAGRSATEAVAAPKRSYGVFVMRGAGTYSKLSKNTGSSRAHRLFINLLMAGLPTGRWAYWMSIDDPAVDVNAIALPSGPGPILVATTSGILLSDPGRGAWTRVLGTHKPKGEDVVGLAVAVDPGDPSHVLAGTTEGLMVSTNGGNAFVPHPALSGEAIRRIDWNADDPSQVLAIAGDQVYQSADRGHTFAPSFSAGGDINAVVLTASGAYVATSAGLIVSGADGSTQTLFKDEPVVGAIPLADGVLAATSVELIQLAADGRRTLLMRTTEADPFLGLAGTPQLAWALTRYGLFRLGLDEPTRRAPRGTAPRILLSPTELERAVLAHVGLGTPQDTRLADRWYAKLLPRVSVDVSGTLGAYDHIDRNSSYPFAYLTASATAEAHAPEWLVWAHWDLSKLVFGQAGNVTNPLFFIESNLRGTRDQILAESRWRYRECRQLALLLANPPQDPQTALLWRSRLEEHAAYLAALAGRDVVAIAETEAL